LEHARRSPLTGLERALRRDRALVALGLGLVLAPVWVWLARASLDMYGEMTGPSAWMMRATWDASYTALIFAMWTVMMVGMMLPSAAPAILIYARVARSGAEPDRPVLRAYLFAAGYLVAWAAFSAAATAVQSLLARAAWVTPMMESASPYLAAALLAVAGAYQWSAAKRACLSRCRTPAEFIVEHWRKGAWGALRMGVDHGVYCVGCCWALMLLLFAGGVMSLRWIAGLSVFVLVEKLGTRSVWFDRVTGAALVLAGAGLAGAELLAHFAQ
jgi:predicted metal-binding membrane protein